MKAYTTIEQSQKLAKILPIESADMYYQYVLPKSDKIKHNPEIGNPINALKWYNKGYTTSGKEPITLDEYCVPCWSLAALLGLMPKLYDDGDLNDGGCQPVLCKGFDNNMWHVVYRSTMYMTDWYCEVIDAVFDMICWLLENNKI